MNMLDEMKALAVEENRRMREVCRPVHPNAGRYDHGETTRHKVLHVLSAEPKTSAEISSAIGATQRNVQGILRSITRTGAAVKENTGGKYHWRLSE